MKWGHVIALLGALITAGGLIIAARVQRDSEITELKQLLREKSQELELLRSRVAAPTTARSVAPAQLVAESDDHEAHPQPVRGSQDAATPPSTSTTVIAATRGPHIPQSEARANAVPEPPPIAPPRLPVADATLPCGDRTVELPALHTAPDYPEGIVGTAVYVRPDGCWTVAARYPVAYKFFAFQGFGTPVSFNMCVPSSGGCYWRDIGLYGQTKIPANGQRLDPAIKTEKIKFKNDGSEPAVVQILFYDH